LLSSIKSNERTPKRLEKLNTVINRYKELRKEFSNFDPLGNSNSSKKFGVRYIPIVEELKTLSKNIHWIVPIVKNKQKIYFENIDKLEDGKDAAIDIISKNVVSSFSNEYEIQQSYLKENISEGINKYDYLINSTFQPNFDLPENNKNIVTLIDGDNSKKANTNLFTYSDNLNDLLYSSSIDKNNKIQRGRFNTNVYNKPLHRLNHIQKDLNELTLLKRGQTVPIQGYLIFPTSFKDYSQAFFKATNIFHKSNLNLTPYRLFDVLHKDKDKIKEIKIDSKYKDTPVLQKSKKNFMKNIKSIYFEENLLYEDRNKSEDHENLLNAIFPRIKELLDSIDFKDCISYEKLLFQLQPFFITHKHITFKQYQKIIEIIESNILNYRKNHSLLIKNCNTYLQNLPESYISQSELLDIIPEPIEQEEVYDPTKERSETIEQQVILDKSVKDAYNIINTDQPSEYLRKTLDLDNSRYLYDACVFSQLNVSNDVNIEEVIKELQTKIETSDMTLINTSNKECVTKVLSKRYANIDDLMGAELIIYFDKNFDDTRYDIYNELNHIQANPNDREKKRLLVNYLITELEVPEEDANEQSASMIEGKKLVKNGHYAVLDDGLGDNRYYVRQEGAWHMDEELSGLSVEEIRFCNLKTNCLKINDKCMNINKSREEAQLELMKEMLDKVENELVKNTDDMKVKIKARLQADIRNIIILKDYISNKTFKYDFYKHDIASQYNSLDIVKSPYIDLRDQVLSTQDIIQKYERIIKFKEKYCREANLENGDDPHWFYCNTTIDKSIKLLPTFILELATAFNTNIDLYRYTLEHIKKERGEISEDGDKMVDKYSGYQICQIEYSTDEGYEKSGAKKISRGLIDSTYEKSLEKQRQQLLQTKIETTDFETKEVSKTQEELDQIESFIGYMDKVIPALDVHLGINTSSNHQFIKNYVLKLMDDEMINKKSYTKALEKDPTKDTYKHYQGKFFLYSLLGMYCIAVQTHIPHINRGKGFSKCVENFKGFPLDKGDNFLHYIICVGIILRGPNKKAEFPFILLPKYKEKKKLDNELKHVKVLKNHMVENILSIPAIKDKLKSKKKYLEQNINQLEKNIVFDYKKWTTFVPPLIEFTIDKLTSPNKDFKSILMKSFSDKRPEISQIHILTLLTKIRKFSLSVQEDIQRIINSRPKDSLFLKSQDGSTIFLENACCNETNDSPYNYFIQNEKNEDIKNHNETVFKLSNIYNEYQRLLQVQLLFSTENTRQEKLTLSTDFTENTIYLAFMKYCKFNTNTILSEELQELCHTNVSDFKLLQSLEEKIDILKSENHNYNKNSLKNLLTIISRKNGLTPVEENAIISSKVKFEKIIDTFKDNYSIKNIFTELNTLMDRYDIGFTEKTDVVVNELIHKLDEEIDSVLGNINSLLDNKRTSKKQKDILNNLKNVREIPFDDVKKGEVKYISKIDENCHFLYRFLLMISKAIANDLPINLIQTKKKSSTMRCPERWDFAKKHEAALEKLISQELQSLDAFRNNEELIAILKEVVQVNIDVITIFENMPFFSRLNDIKTIFDGPIIQKLSYYLFLQILNSHYNILEKKFENTTSLNR
ncbi:MAG: hypothetical protein CXT73_05910, partial [Methanobacteriota archaeon]